MSFRTGVFAIRWPDGFQPKGQAVAAYDSVLPHEKTPRCQAQLKEYGYRPPDYRGTADGLSGGFSQSLPNGDPTGELDFLTRGGASFIASARGVSRADVLAACGADAVRDDSRRFWTDWWKTAPRIDVPDAEIAEIYALGMYRFGAMTDESGVPAGLQGPWVEDFKFPPWNGDYVGNETMQMDGQMAATATVQDMMVHERGGVVRLFAGCPDRWRRVSFDGMLVDGGFLVSAMREDGRLTRLEVVRPAGSTEILRLEEPGTGQILER